MLLLEQFENLTLHPKNAAKLKDLVLQLAVQGKLTENWRKNHPNVESASELLRRIEEEKAKLVKEKKIKKEQPLEALTNEEQSYNLPVSWEWVRLGELGDWGAGATPSRGNAELYDGDINWFKSGELNNGIIDYVSEERITSLALKKTSLRLNKPGDILIAMYGATIGKTAILAVEGTTNQAVCACTCYSGVSNLYLHLLLKAYKNVFTQQGTGGAQPNISRVKIRTTPVPLPPLAEQEAIVARVEELMQKIEELEQQTKERIQLKKDLCSAALQQLTAAADEDLQQHWHFLKQHFQTLFDEEKNVKKLRETILQLAVQGKLTASWRKHHPNTELASELLKRIQAEKEQLVKEKKIKKEKPLEPISEDEMPYELPEGWVWCRLLNIIEDTDAGKSPQCDNRQAELNEFGFIKTTAIQPLQFLPNENKAILKEEHANLNYEVKPGDILITRAGPRNRVGIVCAVTTTRSKLLLSDKTVRIKPVQGASINARFIAITLSTGASGEYLESKKSGMADSQVNITQENIKATPIALPPLVEQEAIVTKVDQLMQLCDDLEQQIKQSNQETEAFMQAVVQDALQVNEEVEYQ